ncbi:MAG TPA: PA2779 family protein [Moraxellaceae bacterium]
MNRRSLRTTSLLLLASLACTSLPVQAVVITTEEATAVSTALSPERDRLAAALARADVQAELARYGVGVEQAQARVAALSDEEVQRLIQKFDEMPAGGSVLGVIVFVFLVLLVTDILGLTKVFPFTRPIR